MIGKTAGRGIKKAPHLTKEGKGDSFTFAELRGAANSINSIFHNLQFLTSRVTPSNTNTIGFCQP